MLLYKVIFVFGYVSRTALTNALGSSLTACRLDALDSTFGARQGCP